MRIPRSPEYRAARLAVIVGVLNVVAVSVLAAVGFSLGGQVLDELRQIRAASARGDELVEMWRSGPFTREARAVRGAEEGKLEFRDRFEELVRLAQESRPAQ